MKTQHDAQKIYKSARLFNGVERNFKLKDQHDMFTTCSLLFSASELQ